MPNHLIAFACLILVSLSAHASYNENSLDIMYFKGPFASGYTKADQCEARLDLQARFNQLANASLPAFKRLPVAKKVREAHAIAESVFLTTTLSVENEKMKLRFARDQLRAVTGRLKFSVEGGSKKFKPYTLELLVIANKIGALASVTQHLDEIARSDLIEFYKGVLALSSDESHLSHALRALNYGHLAVVAVGALPHAPRKLLVLRNVAEALLFAIKEDQLGFGSGLVINPAVMVLIHLLEVGPDVPLAERAAYERLGIQWVKALRGICSVVFPFAAHSENWALFHDSQELLMLLDHPKLAMFPELKKEVEALLTEFGPRGEGTAVH